MKVHTSHSTLFKGMPYVQKKLPNIFYIRDSPHAYQRGKFLGLTLIHRYRRLPGRETKTASHGLILIDAGNAPAGMVETRGSDSSKSLVLWRATDWENGPSKEPQEEEQEEEKMRKPAIFSGRETREMLSQKSPLPTSTRKWEVDDCTSCFGFPKEVPK